MGLILIAVILSLIWYMIYEFNFFVVLFLSQGRLLLYYTEIRKNTQWKECHREYERKPKSAFWLHKKTKRQI